jgi:hypothetical protein
MSLVRLLTSGKTLIGLQESTSRYRMRTKSLLPKFGSGTNPFSAGTPEPVPTEPAETGATPTVSRFQMTPAELAAARLKETKRLPVPSPVVAPVESEKSVAKPAAIKPVAAEGSNWIWIWNGLSRWAPKLNPLAWWPRQKAKPKPAISRSGKTPVQGELSLDNIKVMRNDLSDADVEIIPARTAVKSAVKPAPEPSAPAAVTAELIKT